MFGKIIRGVLAAALLCGAATVHAQTVWKFSSWVPPSHPIVELVWKRWIEQVKTATEGRVVIELVPPLGKPEAHYDLVRNGVADVGNISIAYTASRFPLMRAFDLPHMSNVTLASSVAAWRTYDKYFAPANEFRGVKLASVLVAGPYHVFTTSKKIEAIDDFKGLKLREAGGLSKELITLLGATPFFVPSPQVYDVLSKGVADGALYATEAIVGFNAAKAVRYALEVPGGIQQSAQSIVINQAQWEALSEADQKAIEATMGENLARLWGESWAVTTAQANKILQEAGVEFHKPNDALSTEIQQRLQPLEDQWLEDAAKKKVDGKAALEFLHKEIAAVEAESK